MATQANVATHGLLTRIRRCDEAEGWREQGAKSSAHRLTWRIGLDPVTAREKVRVAARVGCAAANRRSLRRGSRFKPPAETRRPRSRPEANHQPTTISRLEVSPPRRLKEPGVTSAVRNDKRPTPMSAAVAMISDMSRKLCRWSVVRAPTERRGAKARSAFSPRQDRQTIDTADGAIPICRMAIQRDGDLLKASCDIGCEALQGDAAREQVQLNASLNEQIRQVHHVGTKERLAAREHDDLRPELIAI